MKNPGNSKEDTILFEYIKLIDDMSVQVLIKSIDTNDIALALKKPSLDVQDNFFSNMSRNSTEIIKDEMEFMGPIRIIDAEEAQKKIVRV